MPFTVPWRFCGGGCRLVLGFGGPAGGCGAWSALAATGVAAIQAAKLRRLREGFWFTAYLVSFASGIAYSVPLPRLAGKLSGRRQEFLQLERPNDFAWAKQRQSRHQTATSTSRVVTVNGMPSSALTARHSRMASTMFDSASASVCPWLTQPGIDGHSPMYTPSSS